MEWTGISRLLEVEIMKVWQDLEGIAIQMGSLGLGERQAFSVQEEMVEPEAG